MPCLPAAEEAKTWKVAPDRQVEIVQAAKLDDLAATEQELHDPYASVCQDHDPQFLYLFCADSSPTKLQHLQQSWLCATISMPIE